MRRPYLTPLLAAAALTLSACAQTTAAPPLSQVETNRRNVLAFYEKALNQKDADAAVQYLGPRYVQHNPVAADGVEGFRQFIGYLRDPWYEQLPRYLKAMLARLQLAASNPTRDTQLATQIDELLNEYDELVDALPPGRLPDAVDDISFWIEELRVQSYAQTLGTAVTVSPKRIRKAIAEARAALSR